MNNDLDVIDNYKPRPNKDWQLHWLDEQPMLFSKCHDGVHLLNPVAGFIWTCCDGKTDIKSIRKALQDVFVENKDEVAKDLLDTLKLWQENGLIHHDTKICFVTVFNHKYEENIVKLEKISRQRFSNRYYLMPFYEGDESNIIPVYEESNFFQGYFQQCLQKYFKKDYTHYVFIADDLILNPKINQNNICQLLNISPNSGYIKSVFTLHNLKNNWCHTSSGIQAFKENGYKYKNLLPSYEEAVQLLLKHGIKFENCMTKQPVSSHSGETLPYPIVGGYSDFVVVPASSLKKFCHYCGVFAMMNLFVEIALPTALLFASEKVIFEQQSFQGIEFWDEITLNKLSNKCDYTVKNIFEKYPNTLYFHPIKLSKWKL